jgi:hypothetical protein
VFALLASCGAAGRARPPERVSAPAVPVGELPAAVPPETLPTDHAQTGSVARVVLGARRGRVVALYRAYLRAIATRDVDALAELFDDVVVDLEGLETRSRLAVVQEHERVIAQADLSQLMAMVESAPVTVRSLADYRRAASVGEPPPPAMQPGDWVVIAPATLGHGAVAGLVLPRRMLVRWVGNEPRIVGVSRTRGRH